MSKRDAGTNMAIECGTAIWRHRKLRLLEPKEMLTCFKKHVAGLCADDKVIFNKKRFASCPKQRIFQSLSSKIAQTGMYVFSHL